MERMVESVRCPDGIRAALAGARVQARTGVGAQARAARTRSRTQTPYKDVGGVQRYRLFDEGSCWGDEIVDRATNGEAA
jgi:hypothetical protein